MSWRDTIGALSNSRETSYVRAGESQSHVPGKRLLQGWRVTTSAAGTTQLCEVHAHDASAVVLRFDPSLGSVDGFGSVVTETRVGEALRIRTVDIVTCGIAFNVGAGVTRVFLNLPTAPIIPVTLWVLLSPALVTAEGITSYLTVPGNSTVFVHPPEFARTLNVSTMSLNVSVKTPTGNVVIANSGPPLPPTWETEISNANVGAVDVSLAWQVVA